MKRWAKRTKSGVWHIDTGIFKGSGPAPGVLERAPQSLSTAASSHYAVPNWTEHGIEFVFHLPTLRFVYGHLKSSISPHECLVFALKLPRTTTEIVGGHMHWDSDAQVLSTNEHTGHYNHLWSPAHRSRFISGIATLGITNHRHSRSHL